MVKFFAAITTALIITVIILISKLRELNRERTIQDLVSWSVVSKKPNELYADSHDLPLWSYISNAQSEFCLPQEYRLSGDKERKLVKEIIKAYQDDLVQSYFRGQLRPIKTKYAIRGEDFFMFTLHDFLSDHQCDYELAGHDMHKGTLEYKRYGDWGGPCYDATYALTDFAIVFHKMYYIAYLYCKASKITNPTSSPTWMDWVEKNLKETLDSKQIKVSRL